MDKILIIAGNTFRETLALRMVHAVLLVGLGILSLLLIPTVMFDFAEQAGEDEMMHFIKLTFLQYILYGFWLIAVVMGLFVGSTAVSGEIKRRTIVTILPRPVDRWQFLLGKWIGMTVFLLIVQTIGMLMAACVVVYLEFYPTDLIVFSIASFYVDVLLCSTAAFGLGAVLSSSSAFALTIVWLYIVPLPMNFLTDFSGGNTERVVAVLSHLVPARLPPELLNDSFTADFLNPNRLLFTMIMMENLLLAVTILFLAMLVFTRRQIVVGE